MRAIDKDRHRMDAGHDALARIFQMLEGPTKPDYPVGQARHAPSAGPAPRLNADFTTCDELVAALEQHGWERVE